MDPAIANKDFDPPAPASLVRRGLVPALLVNALFVVALAWSVPWQRMGPQQQDAGPAPNLGAMGGPPAAMPQEPAAAPASPVAAPAAPTPTPTQMPATDARTAPARPPQQAPVVASLSVPQRTAPGPSFDCGKARSRTEKLICADAELAQLDRELGRLNVRARSLSPDPAAFRRAGDAEWKRRETECSDKDCLLAWYAQRREQLQALVDQRG
jgi:hypothetical protein